MKTENRVFLAGLILLFIQSVLVLFFWNALVSALLMTAGIICVAISAIRDHKLVAWLPMYILICEMHIFVQTGSGTLLMFYYVLLVCNVLYAVFGRKRADLQQFLYAGAFGKLCFIPEVVLNVSLYFATGMSLYLGLAYSMIFITSAYVISWLFDKAENSAMTPGKFIAQMVGLLVAVADIVLTAIYVRECYNQISGKK